MSFFSVYQAKILYQIHLLMLALEMQVQCLTNPSKEEFSKLLESYKPNLVYLQGEQLENDEVGPLVWGDDVLSTPEAVSELFHTTLPTTVCYFALLNFYSLFCIHHLVSYVWNPLSSPPSCLPWRIKDDLVWHVVSSLFSYL